MLTTKGFLKFVVNSKNRMFGTQMSFFLRPFKTMCMRYLFFVDLEVSELLIVYSVQTPYA